MTQKQFYKTKAWKMARQAYIDYRIAINGGLCGVCHEALGLLRIKKTRGHHTPGFFCCPFAGVGRARCFIVLKFGAVGAFFALHGAKVKIRNPLERNNFTIYCTNCTNCTIVFIKLSGKKKYIIWEYRYIILLPYLGVL